MIDNSILESAAQSISQTISSDSWEHLSDSEIWERLRKDVGDGEGWDEEVLIALYDSPENLKKKIFEVSPQTSMAEKKLDQGDTKMESQNKKGELVVEDGKVRVKFHEAASGTTLDPKDVKQDGDTSKPEPMVSEINRIVEQLNKKFASYESSVIKSAAFRASMYDLIREAEEKMKKEELELSKEDKASKGKEDKGSKEDKASKPEDKKEDKKEDKGSKKVTRNKLDDASIDKVKSLITELEKVLSRIKGAIGVADEADEKVEMGELALPEPKDVTAPAPAGKAPVGLGKAPAPVGGANPLKDLIPKGKGLQAQIESEISKLAAILDNAIMDKGIDCCKIEPPVAEDKLDQDSLGTSKIKTEDEVKSPEVKKEDASMAPDCKSEDVAMAADSKSCATCGDSLTEEDKSAVVAYLENIRFIENFFEDVKEQDKIGEKIASVIPVLSNKENLEVMKKVSAKEQVTKKEATLLDEFNTSLAVRVAETQPGVFLHTAPKADDYSNKDVQKTVAKENIKGNSANAIKNTSDAIDRKFLSVKAQVEKIMTNRFAKFDRALSAAGEALYKEITPNPLKSALYKRCQEAGLSADESHQIVESSFDEASEASHKALVERAKQLASLEDSEFIKQANEIAKADRKVSEFLADSAPEVETKKEIEIPITDEVSVEVEMEKQASIANKAIVASPAESSSPVEDFSKDFWGSYTQRRRI